MSPLYELLHPLLKKEIKTASVLFVSEDVLAGVATHHHVIYSAYIMQSWFPCHTA
jgi:hypothetical protein